VLVSSTDPLVADELVLAVAASEAIETSELQGGVGKIPTAKLADLGMSRALRQHSTHRTTNTGRHIGCGSLSFCAWPGCLTTACLERALAACLPLLQQHLLHIYCTCVSVFGSHQHEGLVSMMSRGRAVQLGVVLDMWCALTRCVWCCAVGTMSHMPPELLRYGRMSPAVDIYAFGIMSERC
jgi:serine/threonine protein kinase